MAIQAGDDILASHFNTIVPIGVILPYGGSSAPTGFLLCDGSAVSRTTYSALFGIISTTFGAGDGSTTFNLPDMRSRVPVGAGTAPTTTFSFAAAAVDTSTDIITTSSNATLYTGTPVVLTTTGTLPSGLSLATTYYVIYQSATTFKLATSLANAVAGTAINITSQGSGTHTATVTFTARVLGTIGGQETHANTISEMPSHTHTQDAHSHTTDAQKWYGTRYTTEWSASGPGADVTVGHIAASNSNATATNQNTGGSTDHNIMQPWLALNFIIKYISYT